MIQKMRSGQGLAWLRNDKHMQLSQPHGVSFKEHRFKWSNILEQTTKLFRIVSIAQIYIFNVKEAVESQVFNYLLSFVKYSPKIYY